MSVLVCVATNGNIHSRTVEAALAICAGHAQGASFRTVRAHPTDRCRNICGHMFLDSPHSHLLFLDSDVVPPHDCLEVMLAANRPLVCGVYPLQLDDELCASVARKLGPDTYGFLHDFPDEPFEADAAGLGCCLIAREVLAQMEEPWFQFVARPDGHQTGEDIYFFEKCAAIGIRLLVLPQILCSHHRTVELLSLFQKYRRSRQPVEAVQPV
ncbi:MAG: hypothetical protein JSV91_03870 [Phycisphaerales bacterium]|nr:MAG: hypothetical protein JSV91_03870 [Phycisphaerales bacterium]